MCAIYGLISNFSNSQHRLSKMKKALLHRGPDAQGEFSDGKLSFGHNRLAILDLTSAGNQPMVLDKEGLVLVYNGEIYNYKELKEDLNPGRFHSQSDTEVLLHAFKKWGKDCLEYLNGMYSFAIWDRNKRELFLARDRFGIKPLYYSKQPDGFYFASEPKGLFAVGISKKPNMRVWSNYLSYGVYEHSEETFFQEVKQLLPGCYMVVSESCSIQIKRYYDLSEVVYKFEEKVEDEEQVCEEYYPLLRDAVGLCFRSDVPVGFAVSGGLDSSILIEMVSQASDSNKHIKAFTYTCGDARYDETPWVKELLAGKEHPLFISETNVSSIPDLIVQVSQNQEEPFGGFNTLCLAELCRIATQEGVTVLLDGNGLDEQWAGYDYYAQSTLSPEQFHSGPVQNSKTPSCRPECLSPDLEQEAVRPSFTCPSNEVLDNLRYRDLVYTKIPRALRFTDRASMMHSREIRVPFLDYRLVEYSFRLSKSMLIHNQQHKYMLRQMIGNVLPRSLVQVPKRPLHTPQREWLAQDLSGFVEDIIFSRAFRELGWFNLSKVEREWQSFKETDPDNSFFVWQWISAYMSATQN